jgi:hypothetical protein
LAWAGFLASIFFFLAGQPFIPLLGYENDEAIFAGPLYEPLTALYSWRFGTHSIPVMLMSYLGCFKTLVYSPIFRLFGTRAYALREPALIFGAASIWLLFLLLRRISGDLAAIIGCWLLAADSLYLLTTCYDWGPVALQHLLIVAGVFLLARFYQTLSGASLFTGCLLLGLAVWDKALGLWMLSGLAIAAALVYARPLYRVLNLRRVLLSLAAFSLGVLPLISYNASSRLATIRENTVFDVSAFLPKLGFVKRTADGSALFGFWNASAQSTPAPHEPQGLVPALSAKISSLTGEPSSDLLFIAIVAAIALSPLAGRAAFRAVVFLMVAIAVAWIQMATNPHTGGSVHHTILLWPWPEAIVAISFAGVASRLGRFGRPAVAVVTTVIIVSCLLVTNQYLTRLARNGGTTQWSAAVFPLAESLKHSGAGRVFTLDEGFLDAVLLLNRNHPTMRSGIGAADDPNSMKWALGEPNTLFVSRAKEAELKPGEAERFVEAAERMGRHLLPVETIADGYGRNVFTIYRLE